MSELDDALQKLRDVVPVPAYVVLAVEETCRRYAASYNTGHPNKKISWRRLNRRQKKQAVLNHVLGG